MFRTRTATPRTGGHGVDPDGSDEPWITVGEVCRPAAAVRETATLSAAAAALLSGHGDRLFVVDGRGRPTGWVSADAVLSAKLRSRRADVGLGTLVRPIAELAVLDAGVDAAEAVVRVRASNGPLPVVRGGRLTGTFTPRDALALVDRVRATAAIAGVTDAEPPAPSAPPSHATPAPRFLRRRGRRAVLSYS